METIRHNHECTDISDAVCIQQLLLGFSQLLQKYYNYIINIKIFFIMPFFFICTLMPLNFYSYIFYYLLTAPLHETVKYDNTVLSMLYD